MSNLSTTSNVRFKFGSLSWTVCWQKMTAIDNKGRSWSVKKDGDRLYLDFQNAVMTTMTADHVIKSHERYHRRFAKRWLNRNLID